MWRLTWKFGKVTSNWDSVTPLLIKTITNLREKLEIIYIYVFIKKSLATPLCTWSTFELPLNNPKGLNISSANSINSSNHTMLSAWWVIRPKFYTMEVLDVCCTNITALKIFLVLFLCSSFDYNQCATFWICADNPDKNGDAATSLGNSRQVVLCLRAWLQQY